MEEFGNQRNSDALHQFCSHVCGKRCTLLPSDERLRLSDIVIRALSGTHSPHAVRRWHGTAEEEAASSQGVTFAYTSTHCLPSLRYGLGTP